MPSLIVKRNHHEGDLSQTGGKITLHKQHSLGDQSCTNSQTYDQLHSSSDASFQSRLLASFASRAVRGSQSPIQWSRSFPVALRTMTWVFSARRSGTKKIVTPGPPIHATGSSSSPSAGSARISSSIVQRCGFRRFANARATYRRPASSSSRSRPSSADRVTTLDKPIAIRFIISQASPEVAAPTRNKMRS